MKLRNPRKDPDTGAEHAEVHLIGRRGARILVERDFDVDRALVLPEELDATAEEIEVAVKKAEGQTALRRENAALRAENEKLGKIAEAAIDQLERKE